MREADGESGQVEWGGFGCYLDGGVPDARFGQMVGRGRGTVILEGFPGFQLGGQRDPPFTLGLQEVGKTQLRWSQAER